MHSFVPELFRKNYGVLLVVLMSVPDYPSYPQYGRHPPNCSIPWLTNVNEMNIWGGISRSNPSSAASQLPVPESPHRIDVESSHRPSQPEWLSQKLSASVQLVPGPTNDPAGWISFREGGSRTGASMTIQPRGMSCSFSCSLLSY